MGFHEYAVLRRAPALAAALLLTLAAGMAQAAIEIRTAAEASPVERLAAKEVARYLYARLGTLPRDVAERGEVLVARKGSPLVADAVVRRAAETLQPQQYLLKTTTADGMRTWWVIGGDEAGVLYGGYRFAEKLGVRFTLHGDVLPDAPLAALPEMNEEGRPAFALRGVNPWGSHPFGFDAWDADDYKAIFAQLAKLRMNFLGIHCYPEGHPYAEPTVWHGLPGDFDARGEVRFAYPAHYYNTLAKGVWGPLAAKKTGDYSFGGGLLFDRDDWAPPAMRGHCPQPQAPAACCEVFNRAAEQFREAFGLARLVQIKTCVGTEAPLILPAALRQRLRRQGKDPDAPATIGAVYEGTFRRIMAAHPLDYYWIWTPEGWTWEGNKPEQYRAVVRDLKLAHEALRRVGAPFRLATAGWVLGPQHDRAALDADLPKDVPMSSISRELGHVAVDPAYARLPGREKWAIPWLESDGRHGLAAVQLFAGRMRRDAADARAYGCTGLMGLHWRTDVLSPNVAALAQAAWEPGVSAAAAEKKGRSLPCDDFYADWAAANFGPGAAAAIGKLFAALDGNVPIPVAEGCPTGSLAATDQPWESVRPRYVFVEQLATLRGQVHGPGNRDRFDWWLSTFRFHRTLAEIRCALGVFEKTMQQAQSAPDPARRHELAQSAALPAYREVLRLYGEAYRLMLATVNTPGGLAAVVNLENHTQFRPVAIEEPARRLAAALGRPLPADALPQKRYQGPPRIIVPTVRTLLLAGEPLRLKVILLDDNPPRRAALRWRPLGKGAFHSVPLEHVARAVYRVALPSPGEDFEYHIEATTAGGAALVWPASAPGRNQTVVVGLHLGGLPVNAELLRAIALALDNQWDAAHRIVQEHEDDATAAWIHAVLHKIEGDLDNSRYWYRRAGKMDHVQQDPTAELAAIKAMIEKR